jgi:CHAT domain-containing protein
LEKKRLEFEAFYSRLSQSHPDANLRSGRIGTIRFNELSDLVRNSNEIVLEFVVTEDKTTVFSIATRGGTTPPELKTVAVGIGFKELSRSVEVYRSKLAGGDLSFGQEGRALYDKLIKPVADQLRSKSKVLIVPDGPLWNLPFQALIDENGKYLAEKMAVSYSPSLTALREMQKKARERKPSNDAELVAFGNPTVAAETEKRVGQVFMDEKLEPLPEAERLVNTLAKMYGPQRSKVYTGAAAREETAKTEAPKYRIVQFATHGILNDISPMYSHLVLAQDEKDPNEDGLLEAWELKDLDLKADMVILSACDTARGKISNGEGIIGMTWAAFIAGAPTTVASQWKVESSSTTELMLEFHRQLLSGKVSKAEALRRAQIKLMRNPKYKHPSYWAAWVIVGDAS